MNSNTHAKSSNFHQSELDKFAALANRWWDADGPQKPLHALNPVRLGMCPRGWNLPVRACSTSAAVAACSASRWRAWARR